MKAREHALKVMQRIIALKAELRSLENELDQILPDKEVASRSPRRAVNGTAPAPPQESPAPVVSANGMANLTDRVLALFATQPTASFSAEQICHLLVLPPEQKHSVRSTLWNLAQKGKIQKIKRGEFSALGEAQESTA